MIDGDAYFARRFGPRALVGAGLLSMAACASSSETADIRPMYEARKDVAVSKLLNCNGVSDLVCTCRREGLQQEFATPAPHHFDKGYAALVAYREDINNAGAPEGAAQEYAVNAVFVSIAKTVEATCSYHEEKAAE